MSINPIELLKQKVTSAIVGGQDGLANEKSALLSKFYPIFLSILAAKPELIQKLKESISPSLFDLFGHNDQVKNALLSNLAGGQLPTAEAEQTINQALPVSLAALTSEAGNDTQSIVNYLKQHADTIRSLLPAWAVGLLAPLGLVSGTSASVSNLANNAAATATKSRAWLPIVAVIILALLVAWLWKSCQHKQMAVPLNNDNSAASQVTSDAAPASLALSTDANGNMAQCQVGVGDQGFLASIQAKVKEVFASSQDCTVDTATTHAATFTDQTGLAGVIGLLKGVPNVSLDWVGDKITLKGADATKLNELLGKIKALVPNTEVVVEAPVSAADSVSNSLNAAQDALANIDTNQVDINAVIKALNLQIINFSTGSNQIPDENKAILDKAAALMKNIKDAKLTVAGFTDSTGNADSNKALSQKRAQAVVDYLVSQGVDAAQLTAVGHGADNPVADNGTEEGRFKNRRIEFSITP
ncbi:OmpA family protein [Acinetobacter sp. C26M]|uniref:OmpA family protein n=1 Tax=unclassified Acinetobacter TaxID=196816 RepID=UPI0020370D5E|nr:MULTISPECIES: OmpA family protein [unclassified Acinetobacter]USA47899.1 OmpA family protein [Acinetobacter sp. C26M]USA51379.1 OmpA family protein [Acinetobacter sp. C26G]